MSEPKWIEDRWKPGQEKKKQAYMDLWAKFHDTIKEAPKELTIEDIRDAFQDAIETLGLEKIPQTREESLEMLRQVEKDIDRASTWVRFVRDAITKEDV